MRTDADEKELLESVEQGPGGDPEASARRGIALSDADPQPAAQARGRPPQRNLTTMARGVWPRQRAAFSISHYGDRQQHLRPEDKKRQ
jgi:hypothetical protein